MSSHDWHVQPVVKDPYDPPPERCRLDRGLKTSFRLSSNLCAGYRLASLSRQRFVPVSAFPSLSFLRHPVNLYLFAPFFEPRITMDRGCNSKSYFSRRLTNQITVKSLLRINLKDRPAFARANIGSRGQVLGSCNGMFSGGFPTGAQGHLPRLTQRTCFPIPFGLATQSLSPGRSGSSTASSATS